MTYENFFTSHLLSLNAQSKTAIVGLTVTGQFCPRYFFIQTKENVRGIYIVQHSDITSTNAGKGPRHYCSVDSKASVYRRLRKVSVDGDDRRQ